MKNIIFVSINEYLKNNTFNENFIKWFNGSKIVNTDNTPKIYYNGSHYNFDVFKLNKISKDYDNNILGFYFAESKHIASMYGDHIKDCYLSIKNPKKLSDTDFQLHLNYTEPKELVKIKRNYIKEGYDGISYDNSILVAFYPNQIKSINNDGSQDLDDDNTYS